MTIRYAPLYVIAAAILIAVLALVGTPAPTLLTAVVVMACPVLLLLTMRTDDHHPRHTEDDNSRH